ncbi:hypothetical protein [Sphingomonas aquatilis]|nr:hypothetical protein [Sphingomonas aquatilis]
MAGRKSSDLVDPPPSERGCKNGRYYRAVRHNWLRGTAGNILFRSIGLGLVALGGGFLYWIAQIFSARPMTLAAVLAAVLAAMMITVGTSLAASGNRFVRIADEKWRALAFPSSEEGEPAKDSLTP